MSATTKLDSPSDTNAVSSQARRSLPRSSALPKPLKFVTKTLKDGPDTVRSPTSGLGAKDVHVQVRGRGALTVMASSDLKLADSLWVV